jgi:3-oxoacyl-[acyl-carrier-protein] synthase II
MVLATSAACASSLQAIGTGYDMIRNGRQDVLLCGGAEEVHPTVTGIFDLLYATSVNHNDDPENSPRPFDAARDGLVIGEGAAILVLEEYEHAIARNAEIYAEITGYNTNGSGEHVSQSNAEAMIKCMRGAIEEAGIAPSGFDYINAHATGTLQGDAAEAVAIAEVFGDKIPVSSLKGYFGHTMGASGAIELTASLLMMKNGIVIPGNNLSKPAGDCGGICHPLEIEKREINRIIKNGFAFGGVNASLVCEKIKI